MKPSTRHRGRWTPLTLEVLENRCVPATILMIGGTTTHNFADTDGDVITVRIAGTAGTATLLDADAGAVNSDITQVAITGATSNFSITYSLNGGSGAGVIAMGNITSDKEILGVYSVPLNNAGVPLGSFTLSSFIGPGFSVGGGLSADVVIGNLAGVGIDLVNLPKGRVINIRDDFNADLIIRSPMGGAINVGGDVGAASLWNVRSTVLSTGVLGSVLGEFNGTVEVLGTFAGTSAIAGNANGNWLFRSDVLPTARLVADHWADVDALRNWHGRISATSGDVTLAVTANVMGTAVINSFTDVKLTVGGSVLPGATIASGDDITANVTGNAWAKWNAGIDINLDVTGMMHSARIVTGSKAVLTIGKGVVNSQIVAAADVTLDVNGGGVTSSKVDANGELTADITGNLIKSILGGELVTRIDVSGGSVERSVLGSGSDDLFLTVSGNVTSSTLFSQQADVTASIGGNLLRSTVTGGESGNVNLSVMGDVDRSGILGPSDVLLDVGGSLLRTRVVADETGGLTVDVDRDVMFSSFAVLDADVTLSVGRNLVSSLISADGDVTVTVGNDMTGTHVASAASDVRVNVTRDVIGSTIASGENSVLLTVGRNMAKSSVAADNDVNVTVTGNSSARLQSASEDVTISVGGTMAGQAIAATNLVADLGTLNGWLTAENLDLKVALNVSAKSQIDALIIDDLNGDTIGFKVGGTFAGILNAVTLDSDEVGGSTLVAGGVTSTAIFNIGELGSTAGEKFTFGGNFLGDLNLRGNLNVDLAFAGNVNQVTIGGSVGVTMVTTIFVGGKLSYLSSNSLFVATLAGFDGNFRDGAGVITGTLDTVGGFVIVVPTV